MANLIEGSAESGARAAQSSTPGARMPQAQQGRAEGEHVVLLQYDGPRLVGEMRGAEAAWRSHYAPPATPTEITARSTMRSSL